MKANYHTHTYLCGHAEGDIEDYVKKAIEFGMEELGFTEHAPFPEHLVDYSKVMRMHPTNDLDGYIKRIRDCQEKYKGQISLKIGLEAEYVKRAYEEGYYDQLLEKVDYLILGQHFIPAVPKKISSFFFSEPEHIIQYGDLVVEAMATGKFKFLAHPDVYCRSYKVWDEACEITAQKIIKKSIELNMPIEVNCNGVRLGLLAGAEEPTYMYPRINFWRAASKHNCRVIINSDAHTPEALGDYAIKEAEEIVKRFNLNLVEKLDF